MSKLKSQLPLFQKNDVNISSDVNTVWSIANTLRGAYRADKYRDVIIPMFVLARLEAALLPKKDQVIAAYKKDKKHRNRFLKIYQAINTIIQALLLLKICKMILMQSKKTFSLI